MEFNEMKKIWDSQNNELIYGINEKALHNHILSKRKQGDRITNTSELLLILVNIAGGAFLLAMNFMNDKQNKFMYALSAWMFVVAMFLSINRIRRNKKDSVFNRSIHSDLDYAISVARYQVRLSQQMRWNILPIGIIMLFGILENQKSLWLALGMFIVFALAHYAGRWEDNVYKARKRELETLQRTLEKE